MSSAKPEQSSGSVTIQNESDIVAARLTVREAVNRLHFSQTDVARVVTAASELARNVFRYAREGVMHWTVLHENDRVGIELTFMDHGPGIADLETAMMEGHSTGGGLGMGLPGARKLMDEFKIESTVGQWTKVVIRKWRRNDGTQRL